MKVQSDDPGQRERLVGKVKRVKLEQVAQREWQEGLEGTELTGKRVKLVELELQDAKEIQVTPDRKVTMEKWATLDGLVQEVKGVIQAAQGSQDPLAPQVNKGQRAREEVQGVRAYQGKRDPRGQMVHRDGKAKQDGEETPEQRGQQELLGRKEQRENEGRKVAEADPGKKD